MPDRSTMTGPLTPPVSTETRDRYTGIIDSILAKSDLNTISEKRIRKGLQEVVGHDLTPQKVCLRRTVEFLQDRGRSWLV